MINIHNNDSHIIDRDKIILALSVMMALKNPVRINLNNEGPCAESLGLYKLLDDLVDRFDYNKKNITINTCNLLEKHHEYNINIIPQMAYLESAKSFANLNKLRIKEFNSQFKHFGNFIGHGNIHRLHLASYLYQYHCNKTLQTYHYKRNDDYHKLFVGLEDMLFQNYSTDEIDCAYEFLKHTPMTQDDVNRYPILDPTTLNITKIYHNFFVEIVNLTYFSGNSFYIDEKIWRPIIMRTPFLIQGPQDYIINLRKLGFHTFDRWWDEGYSEDPGRSQIDGIIANIDQLSEFSIQDLCDIYQDMRSVLDHNYQRLMSITKDDFLKLSDTR